MRLRLTVLAALAAVLAIVVGPAGAITGNFQKDFVHDYVGLVVFYTDDDPVSATHDPFSHRCSGTLISPTVLVTAGHCTEDVDFGRVYFQQAAAPNYDPGAFFGFGGDPTTGYPYENGVHFSVAHNYGFHDFEGYPDIHDVGVVILDEPYTPPSGQFGLLPTDGQVSEYIAEAGSKKAATFTSVGYGLSDTTPGNVSFRERLMATSYLINDHSHNTDGFNLQTTANASQDKGGTCSGDSGGPVFIDDTRVIASVTSFGFNAKCRGVDFSYRLDRQPVLDWIADPVDAG
jgi:V8-like Glu-specific endopeptidase